MRFEEPAIIYKTVISEVSVGSDFIWYFTLLEWPATKHHFYLFSAIKDGFFPVSLLIGFIGPGLIRFGDRSICVRSTRNTECSCVILEGDRGPSLRGARDRASATKTLFPFLY